MKKKIRKVVTHFENFIVQFENDRKKYFVSPAKFDRVKISAVLRLKWKTDAGSAAIDFLCGSLKGVSLDGEVVKKRTRLWFI